jgi:UDP-N-acetylmuramoylalanine--D-glutamate ligase
LELEGKVAVVVGLARSGIAAARFLVSRGARVVATDVKGEGELPEEALTLGRLGVGMELGGHRERTLAGADLVVVSPGVPWDLPELAATRAAGVPVMAELELAWRHLRGEVAAVTGTKGKSTTTAALGAMLRPARGDVRVGGNIGEAVTGLVDGAGDETVFVLEVSSFQLEGTLTFHPRLAVFLNLAADHLDRHGSLDAYARAKARIFANQSSADWAVVNADDPAVLALARQGRARLLPFHPEGSPGSGDAAWFEGGQAWLRRDGQRQALFDRRDVRVPGAHLASDLLAAGAAATLLGASAGDVRDAVRAFQGVEHVLELVAEVAGVGYYNDSKATNVEAVRRSLEAFDRPVLVILGGRHKGGDFADLAAALRARGRLVLAIGEARPLVARALGGVVPVHACASLREAVERAAAEARPGDVVLLAPACASFDMFRDYADRGRAFKDEVRRLAGAGGNG